MRSRRLLLAIALPVLVALGPEPAGGGVRAPHATRPLYVAIGDSLSAGVQPDAYGHNRPTRQGYPDQLAAALRSRVRRLGVVHFGGGGTTNTLIDGPTTRRDTPPALEQAEHFLRANRGHVALVSLNIGDNDVGACISARGVQEGCVARELADVSANLSTIVRRLRAAVGPRTPIVGLADYDQFWAFWLRGANGRAVARRSAQVITRLNATMLGVYRRRGAVPADAGRRFAIRAARPRVPLPGRGRVPRAVARVCGLTWACSPPPIGFNDHANARGYRVIASALYDALKEADVLPGPPRRRAGAGPKRVGYRRATFSAWIARCAAVRRARGSGARSPSRSSASR